MIICCGEALIDMLPRQLADGSDVYLPVSGGAVFNTAIALGRLGVDTGFVSGISSDLFGKQLIESLEASKVNPNFCVISDYPSTLAFVKLSNGHAEYSFFDENSAGRMLSIDQLPELPENVEAMHLGAISLIPEPCGSAYEALLERGSARSVISLDPNIRPGFIKDVDGHRARIKRMIDKSDIVKVSDEDLEWIEPGADIQHTFDRWLAGGCSVIVLTKGSKGATLYTKFGSIDVTAVKTEVVDTVGAGDTFNAGFLFGLKQAGILSKSALQTASLEQFQKAGQIAAETAAITVSRAGANPPWREEIEI
ncbi:MAG: carbohydrate kinase [Salaquimonas sp.]